MRLFGAYLQRPATIAKMHNAMLIRHPPLYARRMCQQRLRLPSARRATRRDVRSFRRLYDVAGLADQSFDRSTIGLPGLKLTSSSVRTTGGGEPLPSLMCSVGCSKLSLNPVSHPFAFSSCSTALSVMAVRATPAKPL